MSNNQPLALEQAKEVLSLFKQLETDQLEFMKLTNIGCLPECGKCCYNNDLEISPLETYPWAVEIIKQDKADYYLDLLADEENKICIFYRHDPCDPAKGHCGNYQLRPLLCRLFGCSSLPDKNGNLRPVLCKLVKEADHMLEERTLEVIRTNENTPQFNTYYTNLSSIDPYLGNIRLGINQAYRESLAKLSYLISQSDADL